MVFETVVADLINRYLGDFVENLDRSQLKLGLWGGELQPTHAATTSILSVDNLECWHKLNVLLALFRFLRGTVIQVFSVHVNKELDYYSIPK